MINTCNFLQLCYSIIFGTQIEATSERADGREKTKFSCCSASNGRFLYGIEMGFSELGWVSFISVDVILLVFSLTFTLVGELSSKIYLVLSVPLVSRVLPSDICKIHKSGASIRMDTTLVDFNDMRWERGDISFIFNGDQKPSHSLTVLDNKAKLFQRVRYEVDNCPSNFLYYIIIH